MGISKQSFVAIFLTAQCFLAPPPSYSQIQDISDFAREDYVHMPVTSNLTHTLSQETSGMHQFEGQLVLSGRIEVFWYTWTLDDESEVRMKLEFIPDASEYEKIPLVLYPKEPFKLPRRIEMNSPDEVLTQIFGAKTAASIVKNQVNRSIEGAVQLSLYQTFVECDRRYYQATLEKFTATTGAKELIYKHRKRCGD